MNLHIIKSKKNQPKTKLNSSGSSFFKESLLFRWVVNNLIILIMILMVLAVVLIYVVHQYYYSSTEQCLKNRLMTISSGLERYSNDKTRNFSTEVRNMVESFTDKDKMELMAINSKGKIIITSSGFSPDSSIMMNDYEDAIKTNTFATRTGYSERGEKIMALSYPIPQSVKNSEYSAIRVVVSMSEVDENIHYMTRIIILCCFVILAPLIFSGFYFVGSIVRPIQKINNITKKYAMGDFSERINDETNDEIGQLCSSINYMANELSTAEAMKNEFISSVSHELRTPLTAIKGWAETLNYDNDPLTTKKGIRVIISETDRLANMVEELLDFSRMQNGKFTMQMDTIDILAELEDAVLMYTEKAKHENVVINYNQPEFLPFIIGDKNRLKQVFINIIDNAIKYSTFPEHQSIVDIKARLKDNNYILISVKDNGCGIKASDLPKVKTKFFKANQTKRGSGIGLAVADEIVNMHHGKIEIESQENVGTTVHILLPIDKKH